jgi:hypothetical protein
MKTNRDPKGKKVTRKGVVLFDDNERNIEVVGNISEKLRH